MIKIKIIDYSLTEVKQYLSQFPTPAGVEFVANMQLERDDKAYEKKLVQTRASFYRLKELRK